MHNFLRMVWLGDKHLVGLRDRHVRQNSWTEKERRRSARDRLPLVDRLLNVHPDVKDVGACGQWPLWRLKTIYLSMSFGLSQQHTCNRCHVPTLMSTQSLFLPASVWKYCRNVRQGQICCLLRPITGSWPQRVESMNHWIIQICKHKAQVTETLMFAL